MEKEKICMSIWKMLRLRYNENYYVEEFKFNVFWIGNIELNKNSGICKL